MKKEYKVVTTNNEVHGNVGKWSRVLGQNLTMAQAGDLTAKNLKKYPVCWYVEQETEDLSGSEVERRVNKIVEHPLDSAMEIMNSSEV